MRKVINIRIPEPCHEDWNLMTPKEKGRHCEVCSKTVIDFTNRTDEQLIETLENQGNLCGRFKSSQLDRDVVLSRMEKNNYVSLAASGLFAFLTFGNQNVMAQDTPKIIQADSIHPQQILGKFAPSVLNDRVVSGTVFGEDNYRIPNATITIKGTQKNIKTDFGGDFVLKIKNGDILIIESPFYETLELQTSELNKYSITLTPSTHKVISITGNIEIESFETETYSTVLGGVVGGVQIVNYSAKERRNLVRQGIIERSTVGKFLFNITNIFRSKK